MSSREASPVKTSRTYIAARDERQLEQSRSEVDTCQKSASTSQQVQQIQQHRDESQNVVHEENIIETRGIFHPITKEILTVREALGQHILDARSGRLVFSEDGQTRSLTIAEAARVHLIEEGLANRLLSPAGVDREGRTVCVLQAIQQRLYVSETRQDDHAERVKVTESKDRPGISVADAMKRGLLDPETGQLMGPEGLMPLEEAYAKGYLIKLETQVSMKKSAQPLADVISQGLLDEKVGRILDRFDGNKYLVDEAVSRDIIDPTVREIVDAKSDNKITTGEAIEQGILLPKSAKYVHNVTLEKLSFREACRRHLIVKPLTLKDCRDQNIMDEATGQISSPSFRTKLSILQAIAKGVLDSDSTQSVLDRKSNEFVTLSEALARGIVKPDGRFRDSQTGETMSIPKAVDEGFIISVVQKSIFDIEGFKDPVSSEFVSLNAALLKGLVSPKAGGSFVVDLVTGQTVPLQEATQQGLAKAQVMEMLNKKLGIVHEGREISVLEAVLVNLLDPRSGQLLDPRTQKTVPLEEAIKRGLITPDGAALLESLLNISVTMQTVTKTIKYVSCTTSDEEKVTTECKVSFERVASEKETGDVTISIDDAFKGKPNENLSCSFKEDDGSTTNIVTRSNVSPEKDLRSRLDVTIRTSSERTSLSKTPTEETQPVFPTEEYKSVTNVSLPNQEDLSSKERVLDVKSLNLSGAVDLPTDGWTLGQAIEQELYDPVSGLFIIPGTDRLVSFEECIKLGIINSFSATVVDPNNGRKVSLLRSLEKGILDSTGHYLIEQKLNMREAIELGFIVLEKDLVDEGALRSEDQKSDSPLSFEIRKEPSFEESSALDPVQVDRGIIYDPATSLVIFTESGQSANLLTAIDEGALKEDIVTVKEPATGETLSLKKAIDRGIINPETGTCRDSQGRKITLAEAAKLGIVTVLGAPLVAAAAAVEAVRKAMIEDPRTGEKVPREVAIERGLISPGKMVGSLVDDLKMMSSTDTLPKEELSFEEAEIIVPQKIGKRQVEVREALESGLIDEKTAGILNKELVDESGNLLTLAEAIKTNQIDPNQGNVLDPSRGEFVTISQALRSGLLDPETGNVVVPSGKHLSVPELYKQGLLTEEGSIIHPETGSHLNLQEAISCEIVDPKSKLYDSKGNVITLEEAISKRIVDPDLTVVNSNSGSLNLIKAVEANVFHVSDSDAFETVPPVGMSFSVALQRGVVDVDKQTVQHPITGEQFSLDEAIQNNFIMALSYPAAPDGIQVTKALESSLIDQEKAVFIHPTTGTPVPINEAIETGLLLLKPEDSDGTTNVKTIQLSSGYVLLNNEIYDSNSGEKMSLEEAKERGIVKDETEVQSHFTSQQDKMPFETAVERGLVDLEDGIFTNPETGAVMPIVRAIEEGIIDTTISSVQKGETKKDNDEALTLVEAVEQIYNEETGQFQDPKTNKLYDFKEAVDVGLIEPSSIVYDVETSETVTVKKALDKGLLDPKTGKVKTKEGKSISVIKAAKMGLLAVVAAPVLAGMAVHDAIKNHKSEKKITPVSAKENNKQSKLLTKEQKSDNEIPKINVEREVSPPTEESVEDISVLSDYKNEQPSTSSYFKIPITRDVTPEYLAKQNCYDLKHDKFMDPYERNHVPFYDFVLSLEIFDPALVMVKDVTNKNETYMPLRHAIEYPLLDRNVGYMVESKTGKKVSFFDAIQLGWIFQSQEEPARLSLEEALDMQICNTETGQILDPVTENSMNLGEAIESGIIDAKTVSIRNPANDEIIPITEAIDLGIVDLEKQTIINVETKSEIELSEALLKGFVIPRYRKPISLEAVVAKKMYSPDTGLIQDTTTLEQIDIEEATRRGIVDPFITECQDTKAGCFVSLDDAISLKLIDCATGCIQDTKANNPVKFDKAVEKGLIITTPFTPTLIDVIVQEYYSPVTGKVLNPITGDSVSVRKALESGFVDGRTIRIKDEKKDTVVTIEEAEQLGLIDLDEGLVIYPSNMSLNAALEKGYILNTQKPWTLQEALAHNCYDSKTGTFEIEGQKLTLDKAISKGFISQESASVKDPKTGDIMTLQEAIKHGLIEPKSGTALDPTTGIPVSLTDALDRGLIVPAKRKISLPEAVYKGFYDANTGEFINMETKERLPTDRAIEKGLIDPSTAVVQTPSGGAMTFTKAIEDYIVDTKKGTITNKSGQSINFHEAFERGLLIETRKPMSFSEAISKGILNDSNLFLDPQSGKRLTLQEAIQANLIDAESVVVKDKKLGVWNNLSLVDAIEKKYIHGITGKVKDPTSNSEKELNLREAFEAGLIIDNKAAISLQRAIHQGLYDEHTGKILDPNTNRSVTLHEAMRKCLISPILACYWDRRTERLLSLAETCRTGVIDRRAGTFKEPGSNLSVSLSKALNIGLIVDIEGTGFGLYEALGMQLYDPSTSQMIHPLNNKPFDLKEACEIDLINPFVSLVKHNVDDRYLLLNDAISENVIDDIKGTFKVDDKTSLNLQEARLKGLIVPYKRPLSIEEAIKCKLHRETGKFLDPLTNTPQDISSAIAVGLIDPETVAVKDPVTGAVKSLLDGIDDGTVDVTNGKVFDPKSKRAYSIEVALERGLLVNIDRPRTSLRSAEQRRQRDSIVSKDLTISEAIKNEIIDPEVAVVKDPRTGRFVSVNTALSDGSLDPKSTSSYDPATSGPTRCAKFGDNVVYFSEPFSFEHAVEYGHLSMITGKFTDPVTNETVNLKEAVGLGLMDPDSVLLKDFYKKKFVKLGEAFRKGLMDAEKGNVLDNSNSKLYTLHKALEIGLLTTPRRGLSFIECLEFDLYDKESGQFKDPFVANQMVNLKSAIESGLIDPSVTVIKDPASGQISSLVEAMSLNKVDPIKGRLRVTDEKDNRSVDFLEALENGFILTAEARVSFMLNFEVGLLLPGYGSLRLALNM